MTISATIAARDATFPDLDDAAPAAEPEPVDDPPAWRIDPERDPVAMVFTSTRGRDKGGRPHVVSVAHLGGGDVLTCTCAAVRSLGYRPQGCFAMVRAREILGMPPL